MVAKYKAEYIGIGDVRGNNYELVNVFVKSGVRSISIIGLFVESDTLWEHKNDWVDDKKLSQYINDDWEVVHLYLSPNNTMMGIFKRIYGEAGNQSV